MSVKFSGSFTKSNGILSAIIKNIKKINLKAVNKVTVTFDPFKENVKSTRYENIKYILILTVCFVTMDA